jgi:hypothetical protein
MFLDGDDDWENKFRRFAWYDAYAGFAELLSPTFVGESG